MKCLTAIKKLLGLQPQHMEGDYYAQAHTWSVDTYSHAVIWRNWCLCIAVLSLLFAIGALVLMVKLLPLKENTPFLVFVDQELGEPLTIKPVISLDLVENASLKKYMIRKFIIARERYHHNTLADDHEAVALLADGQVVNEYRHYLAKGNPLSPVNRYKNASIDVSDIRITFLNEHRAYAAFILNINQDGLFKQIPANADIKFHFAQRELPAHEAQTINPVNFEVLGYQSHHQSNSKETL